MRRRALAARFRGYPVRRDKGHYSSAKPRSTAVRLPGVTRWNRGPCRWQAVRSHGAPSTRRVSSSACCPLGRTIQVIAVVLVGWSRQRRTATIAQHRAEPRPRRPQRDSDRHRPSTVPRLSVPTGARCFGGDRHPTARESGRYRKMIVQPHGVGSRLSSPARVSPLAPETPLRYDRYRGRGGRN
jgi:hypothetical protein